jgi:hypothetical protein
MEDRMKLQGFRSVVIVMIIILMSVWIISCDNSPTESKEEPPVMPPASSMQPDLSLFTGGGAQSLGKAAGPQTKQHFAWAVTSVAVINTAVLLHMAIPTYIFGRALMEEPALETDGKFHWKFTPTYALVKYSADLAGWIDVPNTRTVWEIRVTQSKLNLNEYLWYVGHGNLEASSGDWTFYDYTMPDALYPIIRIDWEDNSDTDKLLTFTNIQDGGVNVGDQLIYQADGDSARVQYMDASTGTSLKIAWDYTTTAGYIQAPNYHDGLPGRWDENHDDLN